MIIPAIAPELSWRPAVAKARRHRRMRVAPALMSGRIPYTVGAWRISLVPCRRPRSYCPSYRPRSDRRLHQPLHTPDRSGQNPFRIHRMVILPALRRSKPFERPTADLADVVSILAPGFDHCGNSIVTDYTSATTSGDPLASPGAGHATTGALPRLFAPASLLPVSSGSRIAASSNTSAKCRQRLRRGLSAAPGAYRHTSYDGADASTPHVPALPAFITTKDRVCPYCMRRSLRARFRATILPARRRVHPPFPLNTPSSPAQFRTLRRYHTIFSMRGGNADAFHEPGHPTLIRFGAKWNMGWAQASMAPVTPASCTADLSTF